MKILSYIMFPLMSRIRKWEDSLAKTPKAIQATEDSPIRFEIPQEAMKLMRKQDIKPPPFNRENFPVMRSNVLNIRRTVTSIKKNPTDPKTTITSEDWQEIQDYAHSLGIAALKCTKLPHNLIFKNKGVLYDNTIVLTIEMDKNKIDQAPSRETGNMVMASYNDLGIAANRLTEYLRNKGFAAHASHPLGGLVLFPPLAQQARLGWIGRHGLLITPEFGPRVRLTAVFTNITNLPFENEEDNPHRWIKEFCSKCGACIKHCPPQAILEQPIKHETGQVTHIDHDKCFPYFASTYGCSVCIKICPFSKPGRYEALKTRFEK